MIDWVRWTIGEAWVTVPGDWTVDSESEPAVIEAPDGDGRLLITVIADTERRPVTEADAAYWGKEMMVSLQLQAVPRVQRVEDGHYAVTVETVIDDRRVIGAAHVWQGWVIQALFQTADLESPHLADARIALSAIGPADGRN